MLVNRENIKTVIPQREPFIFIDELIQVSPTAFETRFEIRADNLFLTDQVLSESALIENLAQTCAAGFGYLAQQETPGEPKLGFIGAVTQVKPTRNAILGAKINTKIEVLSTFDTIHLVQGTASDEQGELISCQLKIVVA